LTEPPRFEWHGPKATANRAKHKVTFEEAATAFGDPLGRITDDPRHAEGEERFVLLGQSDKRRPARGNVHRARRCNSSHQCAEGHAP
jgi:uncharacterized DUF497 family protein